MKICILTHTFPRFPEDTAAPFMEGVAEGMVAAGHKVFVLTPYSDKFKNEKKDFSLKTYKYIYPNSLHKLGYSETLENDMSLKPLVYLLSPFMFIFATVALYRLVKKEKIEIINAHWILPNGFIACLVGKFTNVPVVSTLPGSDVYLANKNPFFGWMAKFASDNSAAITSNSPQLLSDLEKIGADRKKFATIIYGVDPEKFKPNIKEAQKIRSKLKINNDEVIVLGVGRLVAKKGFKCLIEAAPEVLKKVSNVRFIIIGDGDQKKALERLIKNYNLQKKILLLGAIDYKNLVHYYNLADIFILPSIRDEKGNLDDQSVSVMEAMACGKPVITTNFPGYQIIVKNKVNGLLTKEQDINQISRSIINLATSPPLRKKMGKKSRELIEKYFSWTAIGKQYTKLFRQIIDDQKLYSNQNPNILDEVDRLRVGNQILGVVKSQIKNPDKLNCLDIGCSGGTITYLLSRHFNKVIGVDVDIQAINQAKQKYHKANLEFLLLDDEKLPFEKNYFDVIVCNQTYEFVDDQEKLSDEIYRVLKNKGICFLGARNKFSMIEGQSHIPLIHFLPESVALWVASIFNKNYYPAKYLSLVGLKKLFSKFQIIDLTPEILKYPQKFNFHSLEKYSTITKFIPSILLKSLSFLSPNFIIICKKN